MSEADKIKQAQESKEVLLKWVNELNNNNMAALDDIIHPGFIDHNPFEGVTPDKEGYISLLKLAHAEWFPDIKVNVEDMVGEGDKVAVRLSVTATHTGNVMGAEPTGKPLAWNAYAIYRVKDGKIFERWEMLDSFAFMSQLGLARLNA